MIKIFEIFIQSSFDIKRLNQTYKDYYSKMKFKLGDIVMLTDEYFLRKNKNVDDYIDFDSELEKDGIYKIEYLNMWDSNDVDKYYIKDAKESDWVTEDEIEICPEWMIDAQKYNL